MNKKTILERLIIVKQNYILGLLAREFYLKGKWTLEGVKWLESKEGEKGIQYSLNELHRAMQIPKKCTEITDTLEMSLRRTYMRELFENVILYCEETDQFPKFKAQPWFQFARVARNVVSHKEGGILARWPEDLAKKSVHSVSWRSLT